MPSVEISTDTAENTAVTSRFCLKSVSERVRLVTPSLHLTKTYPSSGTAVTLTDWVGAVMA